MGSMRNETELVEQRGWCGEEDKEEESRARLKMRQVIVEGNA